MGIVSCVRSFFSLFPIRPEEAWLVKLRMKCCIDLVCHRMQLSNSDIDILKEASTEGIVNQFSRIKAYNTNEQWLDIGNVYKSDPVTRINLEKDGEKTRKSLQLADYIAVSSPTHLWDGWNYLGLALYSYVCGYTANAKHLAYYAELRVAMSLLASQGVGIFNRCHFVVDKNSNVYELAHISTHDATWLYLEQWADGGGSKYFLDRALRVQSYSFTDWLRAFPHGGALAPVGAERLLSMAFDLRCMKEDRKARNEASYRPTGIVVSEVRDLKADVEFVVESIRLLEPGGLLGTFEMDKFILRQVIERAFDSGNEDIRSKVHGLEKFRSSVVAMVANLMDNPDLQKNFREFFTRELDAEEPRLLREAEKRNNHNDEGYHFQVISRAILLLRVATSIVREMLKDSGVNLDSLEFWWRDIGRTQGFWKAPFESVDSFQLWDDFSSYLDDIDRWIDGDHCSRQSLLIDCAVPLTQITGLAKFALIGLAL